MPPILLHFTGYTKTKASNQALVVFYRDFNGWTKYWMCIYIFCYKALNREISSCSEIQKTWKIHKHTGDVCTLLKSLVGVD